jgi:CRP-like cAMP-binding protein
LYLQRKGIFLKHFLPVLSRCRLFEGIEPKTIAALLGCIRHSEKKYRRNSFVLLEDDKPKSIGIVLSGLLHIVRDDYWGNRDIVSVVEPGELFAEAFVCGGAEKLPVSVIAAEPSEIMRLDFTRITTVCSSACAFHTRLIQNMISTLAQKNIQLMEKIECLGRRSTRSKVLSYLSACAKRQKSGDVEIPFNRQELADYLSVDRSALSAELCRMRDEGLLTFHKNKFCIKDK